jgi:arginyl-tRNA synthetase
MERDSYTRAMTAEVRQFDPVAALTAKLREAVVRVAGSAVTEADALDPRIEANKRPELGDFQCNAAMGLAKRLGKNPREVAQAIVKAADLGDLAEPLTEKDIAGPGFINIRLRTQGVAALLNAFDTPALGVPKLDTPETVVVDLCGVNLAKQMHVGHLRSMIIGDAIARVFERLGWRSVRQNHLGDWGLPIAMVTHRVAEEVQAGRVKLDTLTLDDLDRLYKEAQRECAADNRGLATARRWGMGPKAIAELEAQVSGADAEMTEAKGTLLRLQGRDPATLRIWQRIADVTLSECLSICQTLGVKVTAADTAGESSYAEELGPAVDDLVARGVAETSEGATVIRVEGLDQPCLIRKSDGGFLYATTDLCAIRRRVQKIGASRVIYCVDARQSLHFAQVFAAAVRAGFATRPGAKAPSRLQHAAFGMVLGEDHRPFKTRSGDNVRLADLISEAFERAEAIVRAKNPELPADEAHGIARAVAIAAVKWVDLSNDRIKDYVFSFDRMLAFDGDTGPYLLYALVRIRSIFRKAAERGVRLDPGAPFNPATAAERALALSLLRFPSTLQGVAESLEPHRLCTLLYEVATLFSKFFDACPVLNAEDESTRASRLRLCDLTARVLADGLGALGIPTVERM